MRKRKYISILMLAFFIMGGTSLVQGQNTKPGISLIKENVYSEKEWNEDLDYLVKRLEIMHPALYTNVSKEEFNSFLNGLRKKSTTCSTVKMAIGIQELVARIKDGHSQVDIAGSRGMADLLHGYPIRTYLFSDGLYIISAVNKYSSLVGKKIIKVCNVAVEEVLDKLSKLAIADNNIGKMLKYPALINVKEILEYSGVLRETDKFKLTLEDRNGNREAAELEALPMREIKYKIFKNIFPFKDSLVSTMNENSPNPLPLWLSRAHIGYSGETYWFKHLPEINGIYLQINAMVNKREENLDQFCKRLFKEIDDKGLERLIIDIRNNDGGNHIELPLLKGIIARPNIDRRDRLFLITSRATFSAAQHLAIQLSRYTNVTSFGEPTGARPNTFGAIRWFELPKSKIKVSSSVDYMQNAEAYNMNYLAEPDFFVPLTSEDYRNNFDLVLDRIMKFNSYKDLGPVFNRKMVEAYKAEGLEGLKKTYYQIKPDYVKYGFNMENLLFTELANSVWEVKKNEKEFIEYLTFVNDELPNAVKVCYNLATYIEKSGSIEKAKKYYSKCVELNPAHNYAKMKLALLELDGAMPAGK